MKSRGISIKATEVVIEIPHHVKVVFERLRDGQQAKCLLVGTTEQVRQVIDGMLKALAVEEGKIPKRLERGPGGIWGILNA